MAAPDHAVRRAALRADAHEVLLRHAGATALGRLCPRCASSEHGRPWARAGGRRLHLSLAYADEVVLVVWSTAGPVGVDVTSATDDGAPEPSAWARAEAVLKLTGEGVHGDPAGVRPLLDERLDAPPGLVAWVAADVAREQVSVRWAGPGARCGPATP